MKKMLSKLAVLLVVALVMSLGVALPAMADITNPANATVLRKTILMPEHVVLNEAMTFTFTFAPSSHAFALPFAPTAGQTTITIPAGTASGDSVDNTTVLAALNALIIASPHQGANALTAGAYDWIVSEVVPVANPSAAGVTYDTSQFLMRVHFSNNLDGNNNPILPQHLNVSAVEIFPRTSAPGVTPPVWSDSKVERLHFTNRFAPQDVGNDTDPALVVTKEITGDRVYADLNTAFNFTMTLNAPTFNPPVPGVTPTLGNPGDIIAATIVNAAGTVGTVNFVVGAGGLTATPAAIPPTNHHFQLRDGETLRFPTLPGGTTYTVTEAATANFAGQVTITVAGNVTSVVPPGADPPVNQAVTGAGAVSNARATTPPYALLGNAADFTNAYHRTPPMGLVITNMPFFAAGFAALALALMLTSRSRKRIEEMPIAY